MFQIPEILQPRIELHAVKPEHDNIHSLSVSDKACSKLNLPTMFKN